jgi:hypothetical protein
MRATHGMVLFFLTGCSSSSTSAASDSGPVVDAPQEMGGQDADVGDDAPTLPSCGKAPYVQYELKAGEILVTGAAQPLAGAALTFDLCPELAVTTDASGLAFVRISRDASFTAKVSAPDHVTVIAAEQADRAIDPDYSDTVRVAELLPRMDATGVLPDYDPSKPSFAIVIQPDSASIHCKEPVGVELSLPGHSEAATVYTRPEWPTDPTPIVTGSSVGPVVFFTGVQPTSTVVVDVQGLSALTSPCLVVVKTLHQTGRFRLEPGAWTVGNVFLTE